MQPWARPPRYAHDPGSDDGTPMTDLRSRSLMSLLAALALATLPQSLAGAEQAYETYLAENGQDIDACFEDFPELRDEGLGLSMRSAGEDEALPVPPTRVIVALDASGSMAGRVGGETKMEAARDAALSFISSLPEGVDIGLLAFGHRGDNTEAGREQSCAGVETVYPLASADPERIGQALSGFTATGWTPLAAAIETAGRSFSPSDTPGEQVVYVVSDGEETCGGDPVAAAAALHGSDVRAIVNIVGLDLPPADRAQLEAVAEAGGGRFVAVGDGQDLRAHFAEAGTLLANAGALARTSIHTAGGQARNMLATEGMLARVNLCVSAAAGRETLRLSGWSQRNGIAPEVSARVHDMLAERHARYEALYERIEAEARQRRENADAILEEDSVRAQEEYDALEPPAR